MAVKRRVRFTVDAEELELLELAAKRHGLTPGGYARITALRAATESAWAEEASRSDEGGHRALPTLPPPRSK